MGGPAALSTEPTEVDGPLASLSAPSARARPLCVDLDGTLVSTDTGWEAIFQALRQKPWVLLWASVWLLSGPRRVASKLGQRVKLEPTSLPYRRDLVAALARASQAGRTLLLRAGHFPGAAESVAAHLGCFAEVLPADEAPADMVARRFAGQAFDYVGDGLDDLQACRTATHGYLVGATAEVARQAEGQANVQVLSRRPSTARSALRALRPHQWAKNALVFLPLVLSPALPTARMVLQAAIATAVFSWVASSGYVLNDLLDLDADRSHATKHARPFASGALPIASGPPIFLGLIGGAFGVSLLWLPPLFSLMLAIYFVATVSYSLWLKQRLLLDVLLLAGLYTHRIFSGGAATGIPISSWLLAFSMFLFLSLAFQKRYIELRAARGPAKLKSRDYTPEDIGIVGSSGTATGYMAVLVFALYIESPDVSDSYRAPDVLWAACPVLIYWIGRMWFLAHRGEVEDDPVKFALRDRRSWLCGLVVALIAAAARFGPEMWS